VLAGSIVCAVAALNGALLFPGQYVSTATIIVTSPAFKEAPVPGTPQQPAPQGIGDLLPPPLPVEAYKAVALSPALMGTLIASLELEDVDVSDLRKRMDVELVQLGSRSVQTGVAYAPALLFHARASREAEADALAHAWTEAFQKQVDEVARRNLGAAFESLEALNTRFQEDVRRSDDVIEAHRKAWNIELMKAEIVSEQTLLTELKAQRIRLDIKLAAAEMRQKALEEELSREPQKHVYFRAPSDDVYWLAGLEGPAPEAGLRTEEPNQNYTATRSSLINTREDAAGLRSERETAQVKIGELDAKLKELVALWAEQSAERERLEREQESLRVNCGLVRSEYEKGRMAQQTLASNIVLCGTATAPTGPSPAGTTLVATVIGALFTAGVIAFKPLGTVGEPEPKNGSVKPPRRRPKAVSRVEDSHEA
jgi:hypothetical protein